jgi:thiol:disulfide interchange protein DsbA
MRKNMRFLSRILSAVSLCLLAATAGATPDNPQNGKDYRTLDQAQPTEASGKKVEVIEFFGYFCPHCNAFEPKLEAWVKKNEGKIVFKRVPVLFSERLVPQAQLYYALEAMGKSEEMQSKIFHAIHVDHQQLDNEQQIADVVAKNGIDKQKFLSLYNSFSVQTKVKRVPQLQQAYKIDGVPTLVVAGRYVTSPSIVSEGAGGMTEDASQNAALKVMDNLLSKAASGK